jgi:hypothetical protein
VSGGVPESRLGAALALHCHLMRRHWRHGGLVGPDCGVRLNYRAGRFVKSYLSALPWRDDLYYLQAQGYWILGNWRLWELTREERYATIALRCSNGVLARQRPDGAWAYPNPAWKGRVATAEGTWASIGLVETYRRTGVKGFLEAALRWHGFVERAVGWQPVGPGIAVNYFAGRTGSAVPNNSAFVLRFLAEVADVTADERHLRRAPGLLKFLSHAQRPTGELPYAIAPGMQARPEHFQCHQYNAFQALDLIRYQEVSGVAEAEVVIRGLLRFLVDARTPCGRIPYACGRPHPQVSYHAAVAAAALTEGAKLEVMGCTQGAERLYDLVLALQRPDGRLPHSRRDYGVLTDRRSYPRHLAMILCHLLVPGPPAGRLPSAAAAPPSSTGGP